MLQSSVSCDMLVLCFMFLFYVIITNTMAYWYDGAALAATRSPVIALFWCLIKFTTTTTTPASSLTTPFKIDLLAVRQHAVIVRFILLQLLYGNLIEMISDRPHHCHQLGLS